MTCTNGNVYDGNWDPFYFNGKIIYKYGNVYNGRGIYSEQGTYKDCYVNILPDDDSNGEMEYKDGRKIQGSWEKGIFKPDYRRSPSEAPQRLTAPFHNSIQHVIYPLINPSQFN